MPIKEFKDNNEILARYITAEDAWQQGLHFFSEDEDFIQVGTWGYDANKELLAHIHNEVPRQVRWTQEVLFIHAGSIQVYIYDLEGKKVADFKAATGDILIMLRGGHGYTILENNTKVLEIKNGPYVGAEADRRRL